MEQFLHCQVPSGGPGNSTQCAWNDAGQLSQQTSDPPTQHTDDI